MLGKLCIAAALAFLLSALAHGAEPGANLSSVVPPRSVPTEAANAGFATLAQSSLGGNRSTAQRAGSVHRR